MQIPRNANPALVEEAKLRRRNLDPTLLLLWERLRNWRLGNYRFRRQSIVLGIIVDFWCPAGRLAIRVGPEDPTDATLEGGGVGLVRVGRLSSCGADEFVKGILAELQMRRQVPGWGRHSETTRRMPDGREQS